MALKAVAAPLGSPVGGSGTTGTIPVWSGSGTTLGNSGMTDSGTEISFTNRLIRVASGNAMRIIGGGVGNAYFMDLGRVQFRRGDAASNGGAVESSSLFVGTAYFGTALADGAAAFSGNVGIGTASPWARTTVLGANSTSTISLGLTFDSAGNYRTGLATAWSSSTAAGNLLTFHVSDATTTGTAQVMTLRGDGNVGIGTASPTTFAASGSVVLGQNITSQQWALKIFGGNDANRAPVISLFRAGNAEAVIAQIKDGARAVLALGTGGGVASFNDATLATYSQLKIGTDYADMSGSGYGLKLPATPGATGAGTEQILDCYQENTWTPSVAGFGGTAPTVTTAKYTRVGRIVFCNVIIDPTGGAAFDSTYGTATISAPFSASPNCPVPVNRGGQSSIGAQGGTTVFIPTFSSSSNSMNVSWFFVV